MASLGHESESKHLERLIDSIPSLIHAARPDGYLDYFNQRWLQYVGLPIEDLLGWKWTAVIHPEDVAAIVEKWHFSIANGEPFLHETRVRRADGKYRWMMHHKVAVRDEFGQIAKWYGSSIDIEDRKQAEEKLRRSAQELQRSAFYLAEAQRLGHIGGWVFDPTKGFDYWSNELFQIHGLDPAAEAPSSEQYLALVHPEDREFMASLIKRMLAEASGCDVTKRIVRPNREVRYVRCVGAPVVEDGTLKRIVGTAMDVTEHELLTQELRRREAYLAEAQRLSHTGSFGWKPDNGEVVWSDETYRIFECDHAVKPTIDLLVQRVHPEDRPDFLKVIESASAGAAQFEHTYRWLLPDGSVKHVHALAHALQDACGNREFVGAATDVTAAKQAEEKLRQSEAELRQLVDVIPQQVFIFDAEWRPLFANQREREYTGLTLQEMQSKGAVARIFHPEDLKNLERARERGRSDGAPFEVEARIRGTNGEYRWFLIRDNPLRDEQGRVLRWYGTRTDIEDRRRAGEELRRSEAELRQILDLTPQLVGVFGTDLERLYANRTALDYFGVRLDEWRQTSRGSQTHPDDSERVKACWDRALASASAYEEELRLRKHDGSYRWFLARYNPVRDENGQIMRWYVASTDIEDRKRAEEKLQQENAALREEIDQTSMFEEIVGTSPALQAVLSRISKVAPSDSTVLITGDTGTGKELVARAIHRRSQRSGRAFISVNCAAIPRDLVASELFGHEKGAFTGAMQRRLGRFEMADGGTIFLDEVGELSPETQVALLRVLQEREFERVGGGQPIHVDVRVIAATNRDLKSAVVNGTFRQDLFYRLNVFPIEVPPLRERKDDILMLVEYFVQRYATRAGKHVRSIDKKTLDLLQSYDWPGNIRELQNVIERSLILSSGDVLSVDEMWLCRETSRPASPASRVEASPRLNRDGEPRSEQEIIEAALAETRGRVSGSSGAAARLGVPPSTLDHRIKALKIDKRRFKFV